VGAVDTRCGRAAWVVIAYSLDWRKRSIYVQPVTLRLIA